MIASQENCGWFIEWSIPVYLKFEATCQTHDVLRVNFSFQRSQGRQIVSINIHKRCFVARVVSVQCRRMSEQPLRLSNNREAINSYCYGRNELIIVERVCPVEKDGEGIGSIAYAASGRGRKG